MVTAGSCAKKGFDSAGGDDSRLKSAAPKSSGHSWSSCDFRRRRSTRYLGLFLFTLVLTLPLLDPRPSFAESGFALLGTDPTGDGSFGLDLTYLELARVDDHLELRIGFEEMVPVWGGYPRVSGVEWAFKVKGRTTFVALARVKEREPDFLLFEVFEDYPNRHLMNLKGTYDPDNDYVSMLIPLEAIRARKGTLIQGVAGESVDAHARIGPAVLYPDRMTTTRYFRVP